MNNLNVHPGVLFLEAQTYVSKCVGGNQEYYLLERLVVTSTHQVPCLIYCTWSFLFSMFKIIPILNSFIWLMSTTSTNICQVFTDLNIFQDLLILLSHIAPTSTTPQLLINSGSLHFLHIFLKTLSGASVTKTFSTYMYHPSKIIGPCYKLFNWPLLGSSFPEHIQVISLTFRIPHNRLQYTLPTLNSTTWCHGP